MPLSVKPGHVNPLTLMGKKDYGLTGNTHANRQVKKDDDAKSLQTLQTKQQALQNQIILLKTTASDAGGNPESQQVLEKQLEEITTELKTAKSQLGSLTENTDSKIENTSPAKRTQDIYEKGAEDSPSAGLYQLEKDKEDGRFKVSYSPFNQ